MARRRKKNRPVSGSDVPLMSRTQTEKMNWSVFLVAKGTIHRKRFGGEFTEALEYYIKAKNKGNAVSHVTLYCDNYGFPPSEKYAKRMEALNDRGIHWCPYCMQLRRFELSGPFTGEYEHDYKGYYCPICEMTHRNQEVRRYNPGLRAKPMYFD